MNERIQRTGKTKRIYLGGGRTETIELYEVLSEDMRDEEFKGTFEECLRYLQAQCPNGKCEN